MVSRDDALAQSTVDGQLPLQRLGCSEQYVSTLTVHVKKRTRAVTDTRRTQSTRLAHLNLTRLNVTTNAGPSHASPAANHR